MDDRHFCIIRYIERTKDYDLYQAIANALNNICEIYHIKKPSAEIVLDVYADVVMGRRKRNAE